MSDTLSVIYADIAFVESYNKAVDEVARERSFLAATAGFPLEVTRGFVANNISRGLAQYFAVDGGRVVGWCDVLPKEIPEFSHVGVLGMGVLKDYRGRGLGRRLIEAALAHARDKNGIEKVELTVFESNTRAAALYESAGFVLEGRRLRGRRLDGVYDNLLDMALFFG